MKDKQQPMLYRLSFESMRNMIQDSDMTGFFLHDDVAMAHTAQPIIKAFVTSSPLFLVDARIGMVKKGRAVYTINLMDVDVQEGDIVYISKGSTLQVKEMSDDFDITGMAFDDNRLNLAYNGRPPMIYQQYSLLRIIHATTEEQEVFRMSLELMWRVNQLGHGNQHTLDMCVGQLLSLFDQFLNRQEQQQPVAASRQQDIFNRFLQLVNQHVNEAHKIDFYADRLCLTTRYLGTIIKEVSGETGKVWIDRALVTQAKVMLQYTDKQVAQVSDLLGFPNNSFFCHFFKKQTGLTPQAYRSRKEEGQG